MGKLNDSDLELLRATTDRAMVVSTWLTVEGLLRDGYSDIDAEYISLISPPVLKALLDEIAEYRSNGLRVEATDDGYIVSDNSDKSDYKKTYNSNEFLRTTSH